MIESRHDEALEDRLLKEMDGDRLMEVTAGIARWERLSGSDEELAAFRYVEELLAGMGLEPSLELHDAYISLPGSGSVELDGGGAPISCRPLGFTGSSPAAGLHGPLSAVTDAASADAAQVRGRIAMVEGRASALGVLRLEKLGALGQIYVQGEQIHETAVSPQWGSPTDRTRDLYATTPGVSILGADAEILRQRLATGETTVTLHSQVTTGWTRTPVLTADIPGESEDFILLSCHIDSWYHGAMDNGSANSTVLEVGRLLAGMPRRPRRGVRLAFWSGHSHGRYSSSSWYAVDRWRELNERCVAHVNCDSTGGIGATDLTMPPVMPETWQLAADCIAKVAGQQLKGKPIGRHGDQSFFGIGIPSVFTTFSNQGPAPDGAATKANTLGWWWHTPEDTMDKISRENLIRDTGVYLCTVLRLADSTVLPLDLRPAVRHAQERVAHYAALAGAHLDFGALQGLLEELRQLADRFYGLDSGDWAALDRTIIRAARRLVPLRYHESGPFEHDWGGELEPIPRLAAVAELAGLPVDADEARFLRVRLKQALVACEHDVEVAVRVLWEAVAAG